MWHVLVVIVRMYIAFLNAGVGPEGSKCFSVLHAEEGTIQEELTIIPQHLGSDSPDVVEDRLFNESEKILVRGARTWPFQLSY